MDPNEEQDAYAEFDWLAGAPEDDMEDMEGDPGEQEAYGDFDWLAGQQKEEPEGLDQLGGMDWMEGDMDDQGLEPLEDLGGLEGLDEFGALEGEEGANEMQGPLNEAEFYSCEGQFIRGVQFIKKLGEGSFGEVWEVSAFYRTTPQFPWEQMHEWRFACKVIRFQEGVSSDSLREMAVMPFLKHEHICNMADAIVIPDALTNEESLVCMFFEFCHGTMSQYITNDNGDPRYLSENLGRHWFSQIASALEYVHRMNVSHMDISADNILFRLYENPDSFEERFLRSTFKLHDFGMAETQESAGHKLNDFKKRDIFALFQALTRTVVPNLTYTAPFTLDAFVSYCKTSNFDPKRVPEECQQLSTDLKDLCVRMNSVSETIGSPDQTFSDSDVLNHRWVRNKWRSHRGL